MPAKKKRADKKTPAWVAKALEQTIHELVETKEKLAEANEQLKGGEVALLESAKIVSVLNQALTVEKEKLADLQRRLAAKEKELAIRERTITAFTAERDFLWQEIDRFRDRVMDYIRWQALLPEDARLALSKVTAQEFEDELDEDAEES